MPNHKLTESEKQLRLNQKIEHIESEHALIKDILIYFDSHSKIDTLQYFSLTENEWKAIRTYTHHKKSSDAIYEVRKSTNKERYGVDNVFQSPEVIEKTRDTWANNYGSLEEFYKLRKQKILNTFTENESKGLHSEAKQKMSDYWDSLTEDQLKAIKDKGIQTAINHFGSLEAMNEHKQEKRSVTITDKYGSADALWENNILKSIQTRIQNSGSLEKSYQDALIKNRATCIEKYGVDNIFKSPEIIEKIHETNIERYGAPSFLMSVEGKNKRKKTCMEKYGVDHHWKVPEIRQQAFQKTQETNLERYGVPYFVLRPECNMHNAYGKSRPNDLFEKLLNESNIVYDREVPLHRQRFDFKVNNTFIEINPTATHNSNWSPFGDHTGLSKTYHFDKTLNAKKDGFNCIHIFDWDNVNLIINMFLDRVTVYARNCVIKSISVTEAKSFLNAYHLQGYARASIRYGLFYNDELISVMTFGKPRYNKHYQYELIRYCSCYNIIGGAEKLFKHFVKDYSPTSIISYCDNSKFSGKVYNQLGFDLIDYGKPSRHWYNMKTNQHITDNLLRQRGFDQLFGTDYGKGTSNEELMRLYNFFEVYDCGQSKYVWINK